MEEALRAWLTGDAGVTAQVGDRIAWGALPRGGALPSIALHLIDRPRDYTMAGPSGLARARVQVDSWGLTLAAAKAASRAVLAALSGERRTIDGVEFQGIFAIDESDTSEAGTGAVELFYRSRLDFEIWHSE